MSDRESCKACDGRGWVIGECHPEKRVPLTHEALEVACRNLGLDLTCGSCASLFFTGYGGYEHGAGCTTPRDREPAEITVGNPCPLCEGAGILEPSKAPDPPSDDGGWNDTARARSVELGRIEAAEARATQAEAQAAAMREVLQRLEAETVDEDGMTFRRLHLIALGGLDTDAGRTLLAELEALREVVVNYRDIEKTVVQVLGDNDFVMDAVRRIDGAVVRADAARGQK